MTTPLDISGTCAMQAARAAARRLTRHYEAALAPVDLTASQFSTLVALARGEGMGPGDLADALDMDRTTTTRVVAPLRRRGLVARGGAKEDGRVRVLTLTPEGRTLLDDAIPRWAEAQRQATRGVADWPDLRRRIGALGP